jgi:hypothetical protein
MTTNKVPKVNVKGQGNRPQQKLHIEIISKKNIVVEIRTINIKNNTFCLRNIGLIYS